MQQNPIDRVIQNIPKLNCGDIHIDIYTPEV